MDMGLAGKAAIIGGGSSGIGYATACALAREGAQLMLWARGREALEAAASRIRDQTGAKVAVAVANIAKPEDNLRIVDAALEAAWILAWVVAGDEEPVDRGAAQRSARPP
jgi:short-subunit dehydrogenase